jgi:hypothetical protein
MILASVFGSAKSAATRARAAGPAAIAFRGCTHAYRSRSEALSQMAWQRAQALRDH